MTPDRRSPGRGTRSRAHRNPGSVRRAVPVLACALLLPAGLVAQDAGAREDGKLVVTGTVKDATTGAPMSGVFIEIDVLGLTVFSDADGRFATRPISPGVWTVRAGQLGYRLWTRDHTFGPATATLDIRMEPDPIMLESIRVVSDRIKRRRNAAPVSVRAFDADQLAFSAHFDAAQFIGARLMVVRCPGNAFGADCVWRRGRHVEPQVYIDEIPLIGGFDFLSMYNTNELYLIEVYNSGTQIRVYTKAFAERLAMGKERIWPVIY